MIIPWLWTLRKMAMNNLLDKKFIQKAINLVFDNGRFNAENMNQCNIPAGLSISTTDTGDVLFEVASHHKIQPIIHILNIIPDDCTDNFENGSHTTLPLKTFIFNEHCQANIVESCFSIPAQSHAPTKSISNNKIKVNNQIKVNTETKILINKGAQITHYKLQDNSISSELNWHHNFELDHDSELTSYFIASGGQSSHHQFQYRLKGRNSCSSIYGLYAASKNQRMDISTIITHEQPRSVSNQLYKGIFDDKSKAIFHGNINVHPQAQNTVANQSNKNLLLSDKTKIQTKPELEISADDVKCSHGATTGQLNPDELFYLKSRGIDQKDARKLICMGFMQEILQKIKAPEIAKYAVDLLSQNVDSLSSKTPNMDFKSTNI